MRRGLHHCGAERPRDAGRSASNESVQFYTGASVKDSSGDDTRSASHSAPSDPVPCLSIDERMSNQAQPGPTPVKATPYQPPQPAQRTNPTHLPPKSTLDIGF